MRRFLKYSLLLTGALAVLAGCVRHKTIPDKKLVQIFEEIFLVNAYYGTVEKNVEFDSIDIYRPVLKKYGYKVTDLTYTIENYSKRKSARISKVVESSIRLLEIQERYYAGIAAEQDSLRIRAMRQFSETVYYDTMIYVTNLGDTSKLRIEIPVVEGDYVINYSYMIDSLDQNGRPGSSHELLNARRVSTDNKTNGLTIRRPDKYSTTLTAKPGDKTLRLRLAGYGSRMKQPHVRIDSIRIVYNLPAAAALDSLFEYNKRTVYNLPEYVHRLDPDAPPVGTLRADPPRLPEAGDDNP